jgi:hypothetical protein
MAINYGSLRAESMEEGVEVVEDHSARRSSGRTALTIAIGLACASAVAVGVVGHGLVAGRGAVSMEELGKSGRGDSSLSEIEFGEPENELHYYQKEQLKAMTCGVGSCSSEGCNSKSFFDCTRMNEEKRTHFVTAKLPHLKMVDGLIQSLPDDRELLVTFHLLPLLFFPAMPNHHSQVCAEDTGVSSGGEMWKDL